MINVLILAAGPQAYDRHDGGYPLCLTEFKGKPLLEHLVEKIRAIPRSRCFVAIGEADVSDWSLDAAIRLLEPSSTLIRIQHITRGAACTSLLALDHIDNDDQLLILNANEFLDVSHAEIVHDFNRRHLDAGVVVFSSVHPRYSYVRLDHSGHVVESAEKKPISSNATAGFYWFSRGRDFVAAAMNMIRKDARVESQFYICPTFNELVLNQAKIGVWPVEAKYYHPLKSDRQLQQFDAAMEA